MDDCRKGDSGGRHVVCFLQAALQERRHMPRYQRWMPDGRGLLMIDDINSLEDFEKACQHHDLTYNYSDDGVWWRAGLASHDRIKKAANKFPREDVERIWNAVVDTKV